MQLPKLTEYIEGNHNHAIHKPRLYPIQDFTTNHAEENLIDCADTLEEFNINYRIIFGTLLGIYRDKQIIPHDTDVDIGIAENQIEGLIKSIPHLLEKGFEAIRYQFLAPQEKMKCGILTFGRHRNYLDFYIFQHETEERLAWLDFYLTKDDFTCDNTIDLNNRMFPTIEKPEEYFLEYYGSDWRTPIKDLHASPKNKSR
jgi:hypothetical protein